MAVFHSFLYVYQRVPDCEVHKVQTPTGNNSAHECSSLHVLLSWGPSWAHRDLPDPGLLDRQWDVSFDDLTWLCFLDSQGSLEPQSAISCCANKHSSWILMESRGKMGQFGRPRDPQGIHRVREVFRVGASRHMLAVDLLRRPSDHPTPPDRCGCEIRWVLLNLLNWGSQIKPLVRLCNIILYIVFLINIWLIYNFI